MTTLGVDNFIRANQAGFGTGSDGQAWSVVLGGALNFSIVSNQGQISGATPIQGAYYGSATSTDQEVLVRFSISAAADVAQIFLRGTASNTQYRVRSSGTSITVNRVVAGTSTTLTSTAITVNVSTMYWMRARVIGGPSSATLFVKVWQDGLSTGEPATWNVNAQADASPITGAGQYGLGANLSVATDIVLYDKFYAIDYLNAESVPVTDISGGTLASWPVESLTAIDSVFNTSAYATIDTLSISDSLLGNGIFIPVDRLTASDLASMFLVTVPHISATWTTRDMQAVWITRDGKAMWLTRDEVAAWKTRS